VHTDLSPSSMSLHAKLPVEIHALIIAAIAAIRKPKDCRKALSSCSLVCATWHSLTLRHTFRSIEFSDGNSWGFKPRPLTNTIARLMESNPEIPICIKSISVLFSRTGDVPSMNEQDFERVCQLCTAVSDLSICSAGSNLDAHPRTRNGLSLLLKSPSLRHLKFTSTFRTSFLEQVPVHGLESLTFSYVTDVIKDHGDSADLSQSLRMVNMYSSHKVINTVYLTPSLFHLLGCTQHVHIFEHPEQLVTRPLWDTSLVWSNCTLVDLLFGSLTRKTTFEISIVQFLTRLTYDLSTLGMDRDFFSYFHHFPWSSLSAIKTLKIRLLFNSPDMRLIQVNEDGSWTINSTQWIVQSDNLDSDSNPLFFAGPSRSRTLETLQLAYHFNVPYINRRTTPDQTFPGCFEDSLDRNFRRENAFPSLCNFELVVRVIGGMKASKRDIMERLPSIFGPRGRCEVNGCAAFVQVE